MKPLPTKTEPTCGKCEHGWIVHPPSAYDVRHGESRRVHTPCPTCNPKGKP